MITFNNQIIFPKNSFTKTADEFTVEQPEIYINSAPPIMVESVTQWVMALSAGEISKIRRELQLQLNNAKKRADISMSVDDEEYTDALIDMEEAETFLNSTKGEDWQEAISNFPMQKGKGWIENATAKLFNVNLTGWEESEKFEKLINLDELPVAFKRMHATFRSTFSGAQMIRSWVTERGNLTVACNIRHLATKSEIKSEIEKGVTQWMQ